MNEVIKIPLSEGRFATIDAADWSLVKDYRWWTDGDGYAYARTPGTKSGTTYLHRLVMGIRKGDGLVVDHINGEKLDNRHANLRTCSQRENSRNTRKHRDGQYGFKGVGRSLRSGKYECHISVGGFATEEEAAREYDRLATFAYGQFARLNFPTLHLTQTDENQISA